MLLDNLTRCLETLKGRLEFLRTKEPQNEIRTRTVLIDPLLRALEWDVSDPNIATIEYATGEERADYALLGFEKRPIAILEAKKLGTDLGTHQIKKQIVGYTVLHGIKYAAVTDGNTWQLYDLSKQGDIDQRRILELTISRDPVHKNALALLALWRPNLSSGEIAQPRIPETATKPPPAAANDSWKSLAQVGNTTGKHPPVSIRLWDGVEQEVRYWNDVLIRIVGKLYFDGLLEKQDLPIKISEVSSKYLINTSATHDNGKGSKDFKQPGGLPVFVNVNLSSKALIGYSKMLLEKYGKNPAADVHLKV